VCFIVCSVMLNAPTAKVRHVVVVAEASVAVEVGSMVSIALI